MRSSSSPYVIAKKRNSSLSMRATVLSSAILLASTGVVAADSAEHLATANSPEKQVEHKHGSKKRGHDEHGQRNSGSDKPRSDMPRDDKPRGDMPRHGHPMGKTLRTVTVEAEAEQSLYKAEKVSSPKFTQPLVDTPQTIVVVKKELFQQQAATTLSETLRNTPGITMLMGENGNTATGDSIFMRGFDTQGSIYVDGIRDLGSITRDTFNTEQVEIAKGPAGVDNGRGAASGYVNLSTKLANQEDAITGAVIGGTAHYKRATLDVNRNLGDSTAVRVNLLKQDADVDGRDHVENNVDGVAASLGLGLGTETRTFINVLSMEQSGIPDGGVSTIGLDGYYNAIFDTGALAGQTPNAVDRENFYGSSTDHNDVKANMVTVRIEQDVAEGITLRNTSRYGRTKQDQVLTGVNAVSFVTPADPESWTIARSRQGKDQTNQILTNQTNVTAAFEAGGLKHDLTAGVEFIYESQLNYGVGLPFAASNVTTRISQQNAALYNPSMYDEFQSVVRDGTKIDGETSTYGVYALDTITINPQWELSVGLRADRFHTNTDQIVRQVAANAQTPASFIGREASETDELLSWKIGGVFKPVEAGSIYVSYATSQLPPGGTNFQLNTDPTTQANNSNVNNPNLDPQKGTNIELGTKWNLFNNKLFFTTAIFKSTNENEIATNPDGSSLAVGEKQVEGIEFGLVGNLTSQWEISTGLALMDAEITRGNRSLVPNTNNQITTTDGGVVQWSPEVTFTLWNSYTFNEGAFNGLLVGGGVRYVDSMKSTSITNQETLRTRSMVDIDDYWVFDAMASYPINNHINVQLNVFNLLDQDYIASLNNAGSRYYPGAPLSARLGINVAF